MITDKAVKVNDLLCALRFTELYSGGGRAIDGRSSPRLLQQQQLSLYGRLSRRTDYRFIEQWFIEFTTGVVMEYQPSRSGVADEDYANVM